MDKIRFDPLESCSAVEIVGVLVQLLNPDLVDSHVSELGLLEMQQAMGVGRTSICDAATTQKALKKDDAVGVPAPRRFWHGALCVSGDGGVLASHSQALPMDSSSVWCVRSLIVTKCGRRRLCGSILGST